jgi:catecholate siderophore receptor
MRVSPLRVALLAAVCLPATPAMADEAAADSNYLPSDIVVVGTRDGYASTDGSTATKTPTPLIDVPQTVTTITQDQIDDQAITQLADALRYVPGVTMDTGEGHRDAVYIRGQASTADFYLDGLRDDAQYYRSLYDVERIEVLKGANALIFGRGGGGGVINRVSKVADPRRSALGFDASADSFGAFSLAADLNQPFANGVAGRLNATYEEFDNARDYVEGRFFGISPTVTADLGERTRLTAHYTYDDDRRVTDRGVPSLNGAPLTGFDRTFFGDPDFNIATNRAHIARLRVDHDFSDSLSGNLTGQFADYALYYANVVPSSTNGTTVSLGGYTSATDRQNWIGQGNLVWTGSTGPIGHTLLAGFEIGNQDTFARRTEVDFGGGVEDVTVPLARRLAVPAASVGRLDRASTSTLDFVSAYVQDQIAIGEHLQLIGGVRYDEFSLDSTNLVSGLALSRTDRKWSPRFGVVLKPQDSLSLYASYSTSFLPQSGDQFSVLDANTAALEPEKFQNLEAGVKWAARPDLFVTAAVFRLDRSNTRAADPLNPGFVVLTGASRVTGFEASLVGKLTPNWQASLGYTYLDGKIRSDTDRAPAGTRLQQVPRHQASAWTRYDLSRRFGLGAGVIYQGKQYASISNAVVLPDWVRVDAAAFYEASERVLLQLNIENLFDADYFSSAHGDNNIQPADPLSVKLGVKVKL